MVPMAVPSRQRHQPPRTDLRHGRFLGAGITPWPGSPRSTAAGRRFGTTTPSGQELDFAVPPTFIALPALLLRERAGVATLHLLELPFPT